MSIKFEDIAKTRDAGLPWDGRLLALSINNFRVFERKTDFDIKPITLLTGANNSGKSSLIKALMLLKKSFAKTGLYELDLMDANLKLGDINSIVNFNSKDKKIQFDITISGTMGMGILGSRHIKISLCYINTKLESISIFDPSDNLLLSASGELNNLSTTLSSFIKLEPEVINEEKLKEKFHYLDTINYEALQNAIMEYLQTNKAAHTYTPSLTIIEERTPKRSPQNVIKTVYESYIEGLKNIGEFDDLEGYLPYSTNPNENYIYYKGANPKIKDINSKKIPINEEDSEEYLAQFIIHEEFENRIVEFSLDAIWYFFTSFDLIGAVRGKQEIVFTRENTPKDTFELIEEFSKDSDQQTIDILEYWMVTKLKIIQLKENQPFSEVFKIKTITGFGYVVSFKINEQDVDITSFGYGVMQLIPVLLKLVLHRGQLLIIEEPESNLHPAFQSKLAEIFYEANKLFQYTLIIETHSEYLIRKLQYLTASNKSDLKPDDTVLYYFYPPAEVPKGELQVKKINILEDGSLTDDFGSGFFDEANKIAISLFGLQHGQKN